MKTYIENRIKELQSEIDILRTLLPLPDSPVYRDSMQIVFKHTGLLERLEELKLALANCPEAGKKDPSEARGCTGKLILLEDYKAHAEKLSKLHGKRYGVYTCPHCKGTHLTTKLENAGDYIKPLLYVTGEVEA